MNKLWGALAFVLLLPGMAIAQGDSDDESGARGGKGYGEITGTVELEPGILVTGVVEDSPAQAAGIVRGDIILEVDGKATNTIGELQDVLREYEAGETVEALISRGGEEMSIEVRLETRLYRPVFGIQAGRGYGGPQFEGSRSGSPYGWSRRGPMPGMPGFEFGPDNSFRFRFSEEDFPGGRIPSGDIVRSVEDGSPADTAGIQPGDIVISVDGLTLDDQNIGQVITGLEPGDTVTIDLLRMGGEEGIEEVTVDVTLAENDAGGAYLGITYLPFRMRVRTERSPERVPESGRTEL